MLHEDAPPAKGKSLGPALPAPTTRFGRPRVPQLPPRGRLPLEPIAHYHTVRPAAAGGYVVDGVAVVDAKPHRRDATARALALRIALNPGPYLATCLALGVAGVTALVAGEAVAHAG